MRDIKQAHKRLQLAWEHLINTWSRRYPDLPAPFLTQVFRSSAEQTAFYAQGREPVFVVNTLRAKANLAAITQTGNVIITKAKPGQSKHERTPAEAFDIAFLKKGSKTELNWDVTNFQKAWEILKEFDPRLRWGKTFPVADSPHFEI